MTAGSALAPAVASGVLAAAALVVTFRPSPARRLRRLRAQERSARVRPRLPARWAAVVAGLAVWALVGGFPGLAMGVLTAVVLDSVFRRLEPRSRVLDRAEASAVLPFAADLLGAALAGGSTLDGGIRCVAAAVGGPLGRRLAQVAAALALDADPQDVWRPVADLPTAQPVVRAALRSGRSGAALAGALRRAAEEGRRAAAAADDIAARRAGVLAVLPVGLCFLPAFVLLGVVPVAASVLAGVLQR